jgi:CelD/BcsL family acetyltransferase involved in cellulose biosynthesis
MRIRVIHPNELGPPEIAQWQALRGPHPDFANPFFDPRFTKAVGQHRPDARVCVVENASAPVAFVAVQRNSAFSAMPLGVPVADCFPWVARCDADWGLGELPKALKVGRLDLVHARPASLCRDGVDTGRAPVVREVSEAPVMDLTAHRKLLDPSGKPFRFPLFRDLARKRRKLEREHGPVESRHMAIDAAGVARVLAWKAEQYTRTRVPPILARPWVRGMFDALLAASTDTFKLGLCELTVGGKPVAGLLALQSETVLHAWFPAYDPAYAEHSVGSILWLDMIEAAVASPLREIDMGPGDYAYKRATANSARPLAQGFIGRPGPSSLFRGALWQAETWLAGLPVERLRSLPGRARRWIDLRRGLGLLRNI